ncbi:MAG: hypothetical protein ACREPX_12225 [Rhodanobacteraceae bacterium]
MNAHGFVLSLAVAVAVSACGVSLAANAAKDDRAAVAPPETSAPMNESAATAQGVMCQTDADCPHLACGPCTPGTPITKEMTGGPDCAVNPCLDASSVCTAEHRCEIGPSTRKNPAIWKRPPA